MNVEWIGILAPVLLYVNAALVLLDAILDSKREKEKKEEREEKEQ